MKPDLINDLAHRFKSHFQCAHAVAAYAPGRVEVLGNHTDYNDGFVLSAAIDLGTCFLVARSPDRSCRLFAADVMEEVAFDVDSPAPSPQSPWANYVKGVWDALLRKTTPQQGFLAMFLSDIPLGAGLSSSAALEISAGLALSSLYGIEVAPLAMARIAQRAEHDFAGANCGLLDQISSLYGRDGQLVMTDFRSLDVQTVAIGEEVCFLMCNTGVKHALVDGQYNERRAKCEEAAAFFAQSLDHPVTALRDVSQEEWNSLSPGMDPIAAKRSAHVIGENQRVIRGRELLARGDIRSFGQLMFQSHFSSRDNFENSCPELDAIVESAGKIPGVLGARLSGGGFGGSAVVMLHPRDTDVTAKALASAYRSKFDHVCDVRVIRPSDGARLAG